MPLSLRVLILEDQRADAELLVLELRRAGFDPDWQRVETEADYLAHLDPALDLILSDYSMPQFDGVRALTLLQERGLDIPFILVSGNIGEDLAVAAMQRGAADYLLKDRLTRLGQAATHALEKKRLRNEKQRIDEELRKSERRLANVLDHAAEAVIALKHDYRIIVFNQAAEKMFGYSTDEILGQPLDLLLPERFAETHRQHVSSFAAASETTLPMEDRQDLLARRRDGTEFPVEIGLSKLSEGGEAIFTAMVVDITERKRAEQALRDSEKRFRALVERNSDLIVRVSAEGTFLYTSPAISLISGYASEELVGQNAFALIHPDDLELVTRLFAQVMQEPASSATVQFRFHHKDGSWRWLDGFGTNLLAEPSVQAIVGNFRDITNRKRGQEEQARLTAILQATTDMVASADLKGFVQYINHAGRKMLGLGAEEDLTHTRIPEYHTDWAAALVMNEGIPTAIKTGLWSGETAFVSRDGQVIPVSQVILAHKAPDGTVGYLSTIARDITERKRAEEALREADQRAIRDYERLLERLSQLAQTVGTARDLTAVYRSLRTFVEASVPCNGLFVSFYDPQRQQRICVYSGGDGEEDDVSTLPPLPMNDSPQSRAIATGQVVVTDDFQMAVAGKPVVTLGIEQDPRLPQSSIAVPLTVLGRVIGAFEVQSVERGAYKPEHVTAMRMAANLAAIATENVQMLERERQLRVGAEMSEERYRTLAEAAQDAIFIIGRDDRVEYVNGFAASQFGSRAEELIGKTRTALFPPHVTEEQSRALQEVFETGNSIYDETKTVYPTGEIWVGTRLAPIRNAAGEVRAVLGIARDITERKRAEEQIRNQLGRLTALRTIDTAISSSLDLQVTLSVLLEQVTTQLGVDAADVLLLNPYMQTLEYAAGRGFRTDALRHTRLRLGDGLAGQVALERRTIKVANLEMDRDGLKRSPRLAEEKFVAYFGVPLIAKGLVPGVLEIFHRAPLDPDQEWLDFMGTLAGQAAIAIDSTELFNGLQRANIELALAYDTTLEGWSRALDLRDEETEGHTQRVTEMTMRLARAMGLSEEELVQVRRGGLLHDIGKMGVPDSILLKPDKLTDAEWEIMRRHPQLAFNLLSPIAYLKPALDIPYCHHEKWDGTGYPRGLKGEQIPLTARLFAIVDVWDALRSDRPYRKAWDEERVREHIREQSGKHFDPQVVEVFLKTMRGE
ncbi:MAG: PAS domain S-box protein [Chloroflexota bacterium]|nr:PAS domain S-box protein [Chloroflexota bacterium]